jgi:ABC-type lipoprotein release transport system permease subunit
VVVALLIGSLAGLAMSAAAGARRTDSVVDRGRTAQRAFDIFMVPHYTTNGERLDFDKIAAFPEVVEAMRTPIAGLKDVGSQHGFESSVGVMFPGHRLRIVSGDLPRQRNDVAVNVLARDAWGLKPGQRIRAQFGSLDEQGDFGPGRFTATLRVTAVISSIGDFGGDAEPAIMVTESFWAQHKQDIGSIDLFMLRLRHGAGDYKAFHSHIDELVGGAPVFYLESRALDDQIRRSFRLQGSALAIFAAFLGVTALFIGSQLLVRLVRFEAGDDPTLRALGVGRGPLVGVGIARALTIAAGATAVAVPLALALSRLFPLGDPGLAEPFPGVRGDAAVFVGGALALTTALLLVTLLCARRGSGERAAARPSAVAAFLAGTLPGPASAVGARLALERGNNRTAVPVRSTFATAILGVAAFVIALSVGASLTRLLDTPRLFGWDWDVIVSGSSQRDIDAEKLARVPGIEAFSTGVTGQGGSALVNGHEVAATALDGGGGVTPPVLEGRVPARSDEVALAARTLDQVSAHIGGNVRMSFPGLGGNSAKYKVVGVVVLPFTGDNTSLGEGLFITMDGARRMFPDIPADSAFVRFAPNATPRTVTADLRRAFPDASVEGPRTPVTLLDFGNVQDFPLLIAGVIGVLAAGTVLHLLTSSIRAARRDLAIVKAVGAAHRQLRGIVAWQSSIVVAIALLIGAPIGIVAGRWLWILLARNYGFVAAPAIPATALALVAAGGLLFANLVAVPPARTAARTLVALVLRTE